MVKLDVRFVGVERVYEVRQIDGNHQYYADLKGGFIGEEGKLNETVTIALSNEEYRALQKIYSERVDDTARFVLSGSLEFKISYPNGGHSLQCP